MTSTQTKLKRKASVIFDEDKYYVNEKTGKVFLLKAGRPLKGNNSDFFEITQEEYANLVGNKQSQSDDGLYEFVRDLGAKQTEMSVYEENKSSNINKNKIIALASEYREDGIPNADYAKSLITPLSDEIKSSNEEFFQNITKNENIVSDTVGSVVSSLVKEAKKIIPSKLTIKVENNKQISKIFNLNEKRKKKLEINAKTIAVLQKNLDEEKKSIEERIVKVSEKIKEYGLTIIRFGEVKEEFDEILEIRKLYLESLPEGNDRTPEQHKFVENFIKDSENIVAMLIDIEGFITSTNLRRTTFEKNKEASEEVLSTLNRLDLFMMPSLIHEYDIYLSNKNLSISNDVISIANNALTSVTNKNTDSMRDSLIKAAHLKNNPSQDIQSLLRRQKELILVTQKVQEVLETKREEAVEYRKNLKLINKSSLEMRTHVNTENVNQHLEFLENLKRD